MVSGMRSAAVCLLWIKCCIVVSAAEDEDLKLGHVFTSPQYRNCCIKKEKEKKNKKLIVSICGYFSDSVGTASDSP